MMRSEETKKLYRALCTAEKDAREQAAKETAQIGKRPLSGWSQEKHDKYHEDHASAARAAAKYLFIRMMQINPD